MTSGDMKRCKSKAKYKTLLCKIPSHTSIPPQLMDIYSLWISLRMITERYDYERSY